MKIERKDFLEAARGLVSEEQAQALWAALEQRGAPSAFQLANVLYYFGALIVIGAMGWLMTTAWEEFGGRGLFSLALVYGLLFLLAGQRLWFGDQQRVPGGLLYTMAVGMVPLAVFGLERWLGFWPQGDPGAYRGYYIWVKGSWFFIEAGTITAGLLALRFVRFPFLTAPIAFSLWFMSMDLTPLIFGKQEFSWNERLTVSLIFGLVMVAMSYLIDRRTPEDFAFWGYLFGMFAFWGGLSLMQSGSELGKFFYCVINVVLMLLSVFLDRRIFLILGALGVNGYLGYLAYQVFRDSFLFPLALVFLGVLIIFVGLQYQRNKERIAAAVLSWIPEQLQQLRPVNR